MNALLTKFEDGEGRRNRHKHRYTQMTEWKAILSKQINFPVKLFSYFYAAQHTDTTASTTIVFKRLQSINIVLKHLKLLEYASLPCNILWFVTTLREWSSSVTSVFPFLFFNIAKIMNFDSSIELLNLRWCLSFSLVMKWCGCNEWPSNTVNFDDGLRHSRFIARLLT